MADGINTATQSLTREQIAAIVGRNPRAIKLLENLLRDVAGTLPDSIEQVTLAMLFSPSSADGAKSAAQVASRIASDAEAALMTARSQSAAISALRSELEELRAQVMLMQSQASAVTSLRRELEDLRALTIGA